MEKQNRNVKSITMQYILPKLANDNDFEDLVEGILVTNPKGKLTVVEFPPPPPTKHPPTLSGR